jgi:glutathione S-transferase
MPAHDQSRRLVVPGSARFDGDEILPLNLYGPEHSYFTGKLEAVLRYIELPYTRFSVGPSDVERETGIAQVPAVQLPDDRWMTDSTPIINWLNDRYPEFGIIPGDPALAFFSRLFEDYADEWFWRPAMHYRWDYQESADHLGQQLAVETGSHVPLPKWVKKHLIISRQRTLFTTGDGVTQATWNHVEKVYLDMLQQLSAVFEKRPFLLGSRPSLADFSMFGPGFRHFALDPTSARIMRDTAPAVYEWVARVWNVRAGSNDGVLLGALPDDWGPMLDSIGSAYLPYLCANAEAWKTGRARFDVTIEGAPYRDIRTARYRVWCLEEIRRHFEELPEAQQREVQARLEAHGCWEPLWRVSDTNSGVDPERKAPFVSTGSQTGVSSQAANRFYWRPASVTKRQA